MRKLARNCRWVAVWAALALIIDIPAAWAHAELLRSDPADGAVLAEAPRELRLWFSEDISPRFSSAQLLDIHSRPLELSAVHGDPGDPRLLVLAPSKPPSGVYTVLWKVLSEADGHFYQGLLVFGVGDKADLGTAARADPETAPPLIEVLLRWLNFGLLSALVGALALVRWGLAPTPEQPGMATLRREARRRVLAWALACGAFGLAVGLGLLLWQGHASRGMLAADLSLPAVLRQVLETRWGILWFLRQGVLISLIGVVFVLYRGARAAAAEVGAWGWLAAAMLSLALVTLQAFSGHAAAITPESLSMTAGVLHLLAASVWVGGLFALAVGLMPLRGRKSIEIKALVRPFSRLAALGVGLLLITGLYSMSRQVASLDGLLTTLYGQALITKIALVFAMGGFGLFNAMLLHPSRVARLLGRPRGSMPLNLHRFPSLISCEASCAVVVLLATGLITAAPAPRGPEFTMATEAIPTSLSQSVDDLVVTLTAKPNRPGQNFFTVFAASTRRPPPAEIMRVILRFTHLDPDSGRLSTTATQVERGRYMAGGSYLSLVGAWQIDVVVRRKAMADSVARFHWIVAPPGRPRPVVVSKYPWQSLLTGAALGLLLIVTAVTALVGLGPNRISQVFRRHLGASPLREGLNLQGNS